MRPGIRRETATRETNTLTSQMYSGDIVLYRGQYCISVFMKSMFREVKNCQKIIRDNFNKPCQPRLKEHKRAVRVGDNNSKVAQHANQFVHSIDFDHATIEGLRAKRAYIAFLADFHFLQDRANFWQTDLFGHEKHRSVIVSVDLRFVFQK